MVEDYTEDAVGSLSCIFTGISVADSAIWVSQKEIAIVNETLNPGEYYHSDMPVSSLFLIRLIQT